MIESIRSIQGELFLLIYTVYSITVIVGVNFLIKRDNTYKLPTPEPSSFSPLDLAILRNGIKGAIITTVFELWRQRAIDIKLIGKKTIKISQLNTNTISFNKLELTIYKFLKKPRLYQQLFNKTSIKTIKKILQPNFDTLENSHLLITEQLEQQHKKLKNIGLILLLGFGGTKLFLGLINEKPIIYLFLLMIVSIVLLLVFSRTPKNQQTFLGKKLMLSSVKRFEWLKESKNEDSILTDDNLLYGVAIFGIAPFLDSSLGQILENPVLLEKMAPSSYIHQSGCGYGCGAGGGCSSGGGCGGCGGCGD